MSEGIPTREEAGFVAPLMACPCGRNPALVSLGRCRVRASCFCGIQGPYATSEDEAIRLWNLAISQRLLEAMK